MNNIYLLKECLDILETGNQVDFDFMDKIIKPKKINGFKFSDLFKIKDYLLFEDFKNDGKAIDNFTALLVTNQIDKPLSKEKIDSLLQCKNPLLFNEILSKKMFFYKKINCFNQFRDELKDLENQLLNNINFTVERCFFLFEIDDFTHTEISEDNIDKYCLFPNYVKKWIDILNECTLMNIPITQINQYDLFEKYLFNIYIKPQEKNDLDNQIDLNLHL